MFECCVAAVAGCTHIIAAITEVDGVLELAVGNRDGFVFERLGHGRVTYGAVVADDLARGAEMLAVVAAETPLSVEVPDVVSVGTPIGLHLGEKVSLIYELDLLNGGGDHIRLRAV